MENKIKTYFVKLLNDILITTIITFIIFIALENLKTGLISNYFDMNLLFIITVVCSLLIILFKKVKRETLGKEHYFLYLIFVIMLMILLFMNLAFSLVLKLTITLIIFLVLITYYFILNNLD